MIPSLYNKILDVLFPPLCFFCNSRDTILCSRCIKKTKKTIDKELTYAISIFSYKDASIKKIIHSIKYFHRKDLLYPLSEELAQEIIASRIQGILVPIPMPKLRKYLRGYNQAELIASFLSKTCALPLDTNLLIRTRSPKRQVLMHDRKERINNQKNTFAVTRDTHNIDFILVDDVTTTGTTLQEARKVLLASGARTVIAVTLAH